MPGYITNLFNDQLPAVCLLAQLVRVQSLVSWRTGFDYRQAKIFFGFLLVTSYVMSLTAMIFFAFISSYRGASI